MKDTESQETVKKLIQAQNSPKNQTYLRLRPGHLTFARADKRKTYNNISATHGLAPQILQAPQRVSGETRN